MDPYTSTREQFTSHLTTKAIPPNAADEWKKIVEAQVYFVWDFVGRTIGYLFMIDPSLQNLHPRANEIWEDARGRAMYSSILILDKKPGSLNQMMAAAWPDQRGEPPEFGEEIMEIARRL
ncbi:hypothetical protein P7C71_g2908, partial [Lecanoromycetidae sp. Uapishka_2]